MNNKSFKIRKSKLKEPKETILILCEGQKTEPNYFQGFGLRNITIEGMGDNTDSLVKKAKNKINDYDKIWCVFDRDSFPAQNFNRALDMIKSDEYQAKIKIAYSNEAFEVWYLLHYDYINTGLTRKDLIKKLSDKLKPKKYKKNSTGMYDILLNKQSTAIHNAKQLLESYGSQHNPETDNPSTTVHLLVEELNELKKKYDS